MKLILAGGALGIVTAISNMTTVQEGLKLRTTFTVPDAITDAGVVFHSAVNGTDAKVEATNVAGLVWEAVSPANFAVGDSVTPTAVAADYDFTGEDDWLI